MFATQPITKNTRIIHYAGEKITNRESMKREKRYLKQGHIWCFKLNRLYVRDAAVGGNIARYINHKCDPNCYTQVIGDTIWIRAARNIRKGEELTYDYSTDGEGSIQCRCSPGCKNGFSDLSGLPPRLCLVEPVGQGRPSRAASREARGGVCRHPI